MKRLLIGAALGVTLLAGCAKPAEVVYLPAPTVTVEQTPNGAKQRALMEEAWDTLPFSSQQDICNVWKSDRDAGVRLVIENPIPDVSLEETVRFFDGKC